MYQRISTLLSVLALAASPALAQGGFLGVHLEPAPDGAPGARIAGVEEPSAASIMGLQPGDLVTAVEGIAIADPAALAALIRARLPGDIVELEIQRSGAAQKVLGVLARRKGPAAARMPRADGFGLPEVPDMPGLFELQRSLPDFQLRHEEILRQLQERMQQLDMRVQPGLDGFSFRLEGAPGSLWLNPDAPLQAGAGTRIQLRYPESTVPEERERLRQEAIAKYGEKVEVEFAGVGTSITIERQRGRAPDAAQSAQRTPAADGNREF